MREKIQAEVSIVPVGTDTTSMLDYVVASDQILKEFPGLRCEVNALSTTLEGPMDQVLKAVARMHEAPYEKGARRVVTTVHIDDRRDKDTSAEHMVSAVREKVQI